MNCLVEKRGKIIISERAASIYLGPTHITRQVLDSQAPWQGHPLVSRDDIGAITALALWCGINYEPHCLPAPFVISLILEPS